MGYKITTFKFEDVDSEQFFERCKDRAAIDHSIDTCCKKNLRSAFVVPEQWMNGITSSPVIETFANATTLREFTKGMDVMRYV